MKPVQLIGAARALQQKYGLLGKVSLQLDETIVPVSVVDTLESTDKRPAAGQARASAEALELGHVQLFNPADSGVLVELEKIVFSQSAAAIIVFDFFDTALTNLGGDTEWRDRRLPGLPAAQVRQQTNLTQLGINNTFFAFDQIVNESTQVEQSVVLLPGMGMTVVGLTINTLVRSAFVWTERNLLPSE